MAVPQGSGQTAKRPLIVKIGDEGFCSNLCIGRDKTLVAKACVVSRQVERRTSRDY